MTAEPTADYALAALPAAVYIVGAGPGDPELLTVKAQTLISQADVVVVADSLVPPQILAGMRSQAELIKTSDQTLDPIVALMIARVRAGRSVVRLHSGDPCLYSAMQEQLQALLAADIPVEVVPGISAFQAAAARLRVELTVPEGVQSIILTRISGRTQVPETEELASLATHQASLCLYLSARHVAAAQEKLLQHYPPHTPVAICFRLGWPDEQIWLVPLVEMATLCQQQALTRTTTYIVSPALNSAIGSQDRRARIHYSTSLASASTQTAARSRLYHPEHDRLFRPGTQTKPAIVDPE